MKRRQATRNGGKTKMLKIYSIFETMSGEAGGFVQGSWVTMIRLYGCNLNCSWCDTPSAQNSGVFIESSVSEIIKKVAKKKNKQVIITGGEPLLQQDTILLIRELLKHNYKVQIETNGSIELPSVLSFGQIAYSRPVFWVMDYKCPSSGQENKMPSIHSLICSVYSTQLEGNGVWIKWVIADEKDLLFALDKIKKIEEHPGAFIQHIISPLDADGEKIKGMVPIIRKRNEGLLNRIIFSAQLHKIFDMP